MVGVVVRADTKEVDAWLLDIRNRVIPNVLGLTSKEVARRIQTRAKNNISKRARWGRTGQLQNSIRVRKNKIGKRIVNYAVEARDPQAQAVEEGTKPHVIPMPIGSRGDLLARRWRGNRMGGNVSRPGLTGTVFHLHPGTKPMRFMQGAMNDVLNDVAGIATLHFDQQIRGST